MFLSCNWRKLATPPTFNIEPTMPLAMSESLRAPLLGPVNSEPPTYCDSCPTFSSRVILLSSSATNLSSAVACCVFFCWAMAFLGNLGRAFWALVTKAVPIKSMASIVARGNCNFKFMLCYLLFVTGKCRPVVILFRFNF